MVQRVSILFTAVASSKYPTSEGYGGIFLASPLLPSRDSIKAVSSPHIYAPSPKKISISKLKSMRISLSSAFAFSIFSIILFSR
jgi:hypothetical protein